MKRLILLLSFYLCFPLLVLAETPKEQKKTLSNNFKDIKEGVTTEKDILSWFGRPDKISDSDEIGKPDLKILIYYGPKDLSLKENEPFFFTPSFFHNSAQDMLNVREATNEVSIIKRYLIVINKITGLVQFREEGIHRGEVIGPGGVFYDREDLIE